MDWSVDRDPLTPDSVGPLLAMLADYSRRLRENQASHLRQRHRSYAYTFAVIALIVAAIVLAVAIKEGRMVESNADFVGWSVASIVMMLAVYMALRAVSLRVISRRIAGEMTATTDTLTEAVREVSRIAEAEGIDTVTRFVIQSRLKDAMRALEACVGE